MTLFLRKICRTLFGMLLIVFGAASAQAQTCPTSTTTEEYTGITLATNGTTDQYFASPLAPCESVSVSLICTSGCSDPSSNTSLEFYDSSHTWLDGAYFTCGASCSGGVLPPSTGDGVVAAGYAYPAMVAGGGSAGTPAYVEVHLGVGGSGSRTFTVCIVRTPRPNYNTGGTSFTNAPLISTGSVQYSSLDSNGQYYKIHIGSGDTTYVAGRAVADSIYPPTLYIQLYDPSQNLIGAYYTTSFVDTLYFPPLGSSPSGHYWTNSGAAGDFYLKVTAYYSIVTDLQVSLLTVSATSFSLTGVNTALGMFSTSYLYNSTGDTSNYISAIPTPLTAYLNPSYSQSLSSNPNSDCATSLSFVEAVGIGPVNSVVTAGPTGSGSCTNASGIFAVSATAVGLSGSNTLTLIVPPQKLIQMAQGEMGAQTAAGDESMPAALLVAKNRFGDPRFHSGSTKWVGQLVSGEFTYSGTVDGVAPEIKHAAEVYAGISSVTIPSGAKAYWSPTDTQFYSIESLSTTTANGVSNAAWHDLGAPDLWNGSGEYKQVLIKSTIANNLTANKTNSPALILFRLAPSESDPAVIWID